MKRFLQVLLFASLGALLMAGVLAALLIHNLPAEGIHLTIDDESWSFPAMGAGHWLAATLVMLVLGLVLLIVVPLVLLLGVGLPLLLAGLGVGIAVAVALLAAGLLLSPVLLVGGMLWLLWRALAGKPAAPSSAATEPPAATIRA